MRNPCRRDGIGAPIVKIPSLLKRLDFIGKSIPLKAHSAKEDTLETRFFFDNF
jgi:hypothetical protein